MDKWKDILLILLVVAVLLILLRMGKVMQLQNATLLSVANKLGIEPQTKSLSAGDIDDDEECTECEEENEETEEESDESEEDSVVKDNGPTSTPVKITRPRKEVSGEPKIKRSVIFDLVLALFGDGMPRKRKDIELQIDFSGKENKGSGYMGDLIQTMKTKGMLGAQYFDLGDKFKSYYYFGLPEWFEDGRLIPAYAEKIGIKTEKIEESTIIEDSQKAEN